MVICMDMDKEKTEFWKKQKKIWTGFGIFMAFMFFCTLVSRAVYSSKLPQVSVEKPRRMAVSHKVETEGIVRQGREYAVNVKEGLRVETVYARVGDKVDSETLLFELDLEDLQETITEKELAVKKLQLEISAQEKNRALEEAEQQTGNTRAMEDYVQAVEEAAENLKRAEDELGYEEKELKEIRDNKVSVTSEEERKAALEKYENWKKEEERLKKERDEAKEAYEAAQKKPEEAEGEAGEDNPDAGASDSAGEEAAGTETAGTEETGEEAEAKERYEKAAQAYQEFMANPMQAPDFSGEDSRLDAWEAEKEAQKDKVNAAELAVEDARTENEKAILEAQRKLEDENAEGKADNSLEINRLELSALQAELSVYQQILESEGKVYPKTEGIVTKIQVSPGERTPDGAALVCADLSSPMQFEVSLTKEQKKYVNQGDAVTLSFGGLSEKEYEVDYIAENESNPELYEACIFLPEDVGTIGQSGSFEAQSQSETYSCCIPINALREDANHLKYVYIVSEKEGILGKELAAEMVYVKVLDKNDSYAAIEEGVIDSGTELIISSTEPLEDRDVIRYKE